MSIGDSSTLSNAEPAATEVATTTLAPPPKEADVLAMLRGVVDPELNVDIVELGMVERITVSPGGFVEIVIETKSPGGDDEEYSGTYKLKVYTTEDKAAPEGKETIVEGAASCSVG